MFELVALWLIAAGFGLHYDLPFGLGMAGCAMIILSVGHRERIMFHPLHLPHTKPGGRDTDGEDDWTP